MTNRNSRLTVILAVLAGLGLAAVAVPVPSGPVGETVITSDTLLFDYRQRMCVFEGNVVITEPQVRMESQKLHVFFDASNNVESVVATEGVKVIQDNRVATCGRAVYTAESGAIVMTIDPVLSRGRDELRGDEIRIYVNSEKVISTPGRLVVYPSDSPDREHLGTKNNSAAQN